MDRLGVSVSDVVRGTGLSVATVGKVVRGETVWDTSLAKFLAYPGWTNDDREAISAHIAPVVVSSTTGSAHTRSTNPDGVGWTAVERMEVKTSTLASETGLPRRTVYKVLNGARVGIGSLARFLGYHGLTDVERVDLIEVHGYTPHTVMGRLVGLSEGEGQPMTTIVRGQG
tara:strand:- start:580 stop:1092 length:513 start_codon:yes stop_codon:yes gene_type:complete